VGPDEVVLADEFIEGARTQEISEWRDLLQALSDGVVKERRGSRTFRRDADA
jgi:hypothetical protein